MIEQDFIAAIKAGDIQTVDGLLKEHPILMHASDAGVSPILVSIYHMEPEITKLLVRKAHNEIDLFEASALGDVNKLTELLGADPDSKNAFSADGFFPLGYACFFGHEDCVRVLIDAEANVNMQSKNQLNVAPVHSAIASKQIGILKMLVEAGADLNATQQAGFTPLHSAAHEGRADMVAFLLENGANPTLRDDSGQTASQIARNRKFAGVAAILEHGAANWKK